jgi:uncharacterized protein (TIGR02145 family)
MNQVYTYRGFTGVKIGDQFWMNKNLDVGDGIVINGEMVFTWLEAIKSIPGGWRLPDAQDWINVIQDDKYLENLYKYEKDTTESRDISGNNVYGLNLYFEDSYITSTEIDSDYYKVYWKGDFYESEKHDIDNIKASRHLIRCIQDWNIVKEWLDNREVELDDLDEINESKKFFNLTEKLL